MYVKPTSSGILSILAALTLGCFTLASGQSQAPAAHPESAPIYNVTVVGRTVDAINYQYRSGPTKVDFRGTVLLPQAKGDATVESKAGRTEIDAHFEHLAPSQQFGTEYLTYVLWAITPEGHAKNLGELISNASDKGHTQVTTDLQSFGLIVTAEPYSTVRLPSDIVVLENQVRPDTIGSAVPIHARLELMPRGAYTYNVPSGPTPQGRKVSMSEYEATLELYQAQNAVQIAEAQGAGKYAADVLAKARSEYENAQNMLSHHGDKSQVITAAREAAQTAEDARALATARKDSAELASARSDAAHEQELRLQAEAKARQAQADAAAAQAQIVAADNALQSEKNAHAEAASHVDTPAITKADAVAEAKAAPPPPPPAPTASAPTASTPPEAVPPVQKYDPGHGAPDQARMALRGELLAQLNQSLQALDTGRGMEVILRDSAFDGSTLLPSIAASLGRVAGVVMSHPGLTVEVDGNSDTAGDAGEHLSADRANAVKEALIHIGLPANEITARGLGNSRPFGPNATAQGKADNRRVEIIVRGEPIGDQPVWDKAYTLKQSR